MALNAHNLMPFEGKKRKSLPKRELRAASQTDFSFNQTTDAGDKSQKGFNFDSFAPGPLAKFNENTQKAYDNATTDNARENIAEASAKREGSHPLPTLDDAEVRDKSPDNAPTTHPVRIR
jgi:hypothetical protein